MGLTLEQGPAGPVYGPAGGAGLPLLWRRRLAFFGRHL
jgi:hypothetical protein